MWILLLIWIIIVVDGRAINECRLVLHALTAGVCHLHLALLPLRHALQHFTTAACHILIYPCVHGFNNMPPSSFRKGYAGFLEGVCLLCECASQLLALVSCVCVAVAHGLQGALCLCASTAQCAQHPLLLLLTDEEGEWVKELKQQRERLKKQRKQMEKYL